LKAVPVGVLITQQVRLLSGFLRTLGRFRLHAARFRYQLVTLVVDLHVAHHAGTALVAASPHELGAVLTPGGHQEGAASEVVHTCVNKGTYSSLYNVVLAKISMRCILYF